MPLLHSAVLVVAVGPSDHIIVLRHCVLVVISLVIGGAAGVLLVGHAAVRP